MNGDGGPCPEVWWISRLCEEFHCLPSEAEREMGRVRAGLLEDIVEARAFVATWQAWDRAKNKSDVPPSPMLDLVQTIEFRVMKEDADGQAAAGD